MFYVFINRNISQYVFIGSHSMCVWRRGCVHIDVSPMPLYKEELVAPHGE